MQQTSKVFPREAQILYLCFMGYDNHSISHMLQIHPSNVADGIHRACVRLGAVNAPHLARRLLETQAWQVNDLPDRFITHHISPRMLKTTS